MSRRTNSSSRYRIAALLAACLQASSAEALLPTHAEPRFHLQAIEVHGTRHVSSSVVASQSLLEPGRVYTESELHDAVRRIRQLPFILEVDFALTKGRERGTYVLLVDVRETKPLFYQLDLLHSRFGEPLAFKSTGTLDDVGTSNATVGARAFVGRYGLFFAAAGSEGAQVGFTRYNLLQRGVVLSVGLSTDTCCATSIAALGLDPTLSSWIDDENAASAKLSLSVPLGVHQSFHGSLARRESDEGFRLPALGRQEPGEVLDYENRTEDEIRLAWHYDTRDDPVFASEGTSLVVAVDYRTLEAELASAEMSSDLLRLSVLGRRHWPFSRRQTLAAGLALAVGRGSVENLPVFPQRGTSVGGRRGTSVGAGELVNDSLSSWELTATIRHTLSLYRAKKARRYREVYWHNTLEYSIDGTSPGFARTYPSPEIVAFSSAVVFRHAWGIVRIGLRWIDVGDVL